MKASDPDLPPLPRGYEERMARHSEPPRLQPAGRDTSGRAAFLAPEAAKAWESMRRCAAGSGVVLLLVSAYRSVERQREIVAGKIAAGVPLADILIVSEHHSGRAVDVGAPGCDDLTERFEDTPQFAWLSEHAGRFGFALTYPRGNRCAIAYEPWHWCFGGSDAPGEGSHG
jgi:D-alanyl-D-alanine carboxypeptidase